MKCLPWLLVAVSVLNPLGAQGAENANARIWCLSLRFQQGSDSFGDTLDLSTISSGLNGELAPYNGLTYISGFSLDDFNYSGLTVNGTIFINLPQTTDINGNGFNDFFESKLGVSATTTGNYSTGLGNGTVTANWSRTAGSSQGSCGLHLVDNTFGDLGYFSHFFQLLEFTGPLAFTPGSNAVSGNVNLVQTDNAATQLQGPVQFVKVSTNRFNRLILQPGGWTNSAAQTLTYTNDLFFRDQPWTTNYYGFVEFDDGDPNTGEADYRFWVLSIDDANDGNHNGIPDFSDDPQSVSPPSSPILGLKWTSTNVLITISGTVGHVHEVQQSPVLPSTNWQTIASVTLTNSLQLLPIAYPSANAVFWRAIAH